MGALTETETGAYLEEHGGTSSIYRSTSGFLPFKMFGGMTSDWSGISISVSRMR